MKIATAFLVAVTVLTRFQGSLTLPGNWLTSAATVISSVVDKSKTGIESTVSKVGEAVESITTIEIDEADKQFVNQNIRNCEEALARAKKIVEDALLGATDITKPSIAAVGLWVGTIKKSCDVLHPQIRKAIEDGSILGLEAAVLVSSAAIEANKAILAKFDDYYPAEEVKAGVSKEIHTVLDCSEINIDKIKSLLTNSGVDSLVSLYNRDY